jgi:hypothetical protein
MADGPDLGQALGPCQDELERLDQFFDSQREELGKIENSAKSNTARAKQLGNLAEQEQPKFRQARRLAERLETDLARHGAEQQKEVKAAEVALRRLNRRVFFAERYLDLLTLARGTWWLVCTLFRILCRELSPWTWWHRARACAGWLGQALRREFAYRTWRRRVAALWSHSDEEEHVEEGDHSAASGLFRDIEPSHRSPVPDEEIGVPQKRSRPRDKP